MKWIDEPLGEEPIHWDRAAVRLFHRILDVLETEAPLPVGNAQWLKEYIHRVASERDHAYVTDGDVARAFTQLINYNHREQGLPLLPMPKY
jgi:hypothetical protein